MGEELTRENNNEVRQREYFVQLLKADEINEVGGNVKRTKIGGNERVVRKVMREKIIGALKETKGGKDAGMEAFLV